MNQDEFDQWMSEGSPNSTPINPTNLDLAKELNASQDQMLSSIQNGAFATGIKPSEYDKYIPEGFDPRKDDIDKIRAERQPWTDQLGNSLAQIGGDVIVGGLVSAVGATLEAPRSFYKEAFLGEMTDFNNDLIQLGEDISQATRDNFQIHRANPNTAFDVSDTGWWFGNIPSIASSISMMIPGVGAVKGISALSKLAKASKGTNFASKTFKSLANMPDGAKYAIKGGVSAGVMRNAENFKESLAVYNETYQKMAESLNDPSKILELETSELAKEMETKGIELTPENMVKYASSKAAMRSYMVNSTNIVFDFLQIAPFLNKVPGTRNAFGINSKVLKEQYGNLTTSQKILSRINPMVSGTGRQLSEGVEEVINYIGGEEGRHLASRYMNEGEDSDFSSRLGEYLKDGHAWESGFWGVLGGVTFEGGMNLLSGQNKATKDRKIAEIKNRKVVLAKYANQIKGVMADDTITQEQKQLQMDHYNGQLAAELALHASHAGNVDLLLSQLDDSDFQKILSETMGVDLSDVDASLGKLKDIILKTEKRFKRYGSKLFTRNINAITKARLIDESVKMDMSIESSNARIKDIEKSVEQMISEDDFLMRNPNGNYREAISKEAHTIALQIAREAENAFAESESTKEDYQHAKARRVALESKMDAFKDVASMDLSQIDSRIVEHLAEKAYLEVTVDDFIAFNATRLNKENVEEADKNTTQAIKKAEKAVADAVKKDLEDPENSLTEQELKEKYGDLEAVEQAINQAEQENQAAKKEQADINAVEQSLNPEIPNLTPAQEAAMEADSPFAGLDIAETDKVLEQAEQQVSAKTPEDEHFDNIFGAIEGTESKNKEKTTKPKAKPKANTGEVSTAIPSEEDLAEMAGVNTEPAHNEDLINTEDLAAVNNPVEPAPTTEVQDSSEEVTIESLERRKQEELETLSFDEATQMKLDSYKKKDKAKYLRELSAEARKSVKGKEIAYRYDAQIKLLDPNATIAERIMAKHFLEDTRRPYNSARLSNIEESINKIKNGEVLSSLDNVVKAFYNAELAALKGEPEQEQQPAVPTVKEDPAQVIFSEEHSSSPAVSSWERIEASRKGKMPRQYMQDENGIFYVSTGSSVENVYNGELSSERLRRGDAVVLRVDKANPYYAENKDSVDNVPIQIYDQEGNPTGMHMTTVGALERQLQTEQSKPSPAQWKIARLTSEIASNRKTRQAIAETGEVQTKISQFYGAQVLHAPEKKSLSKIPGISKQTEYSSGDNKGIYIGDDPSSAELVNTSERPYILSEGDEYSSSLGRGKAYFPIPLPQGGIMLSPMDSRKLNESQTEHILSSLVELGALHLAGDIKGVKQGLAELNHLINVNYNFEAVGLSYDHKSGRFYYNYKGAKSGQMIRINFFTQEGSNKLRIGSSKKINGKWVKQSKSISLDQNSTELIATLHKNTFSKIYQNIDTKRLNTSDGFVDPVTGIEYKSYNAYVAASSDSDLGAVVNKDTGKVLSYFTDKGTTPKGRREQKQSGKSAPMKSLQIKVAPVEVVSSSENVVTTPEAKQSPIETVPEKESTSPDQVINIYAGTGENAELSNFAERPFTADIGNYKTVEGAFQAEKIFYTKNNEYVVNDEVTDKGHALLDKLEKASGKEAKKLGRTISGLDVQTWDNAAESIMEDLIKESFGQNPAALQKLLDTGDVTLTHTQDKSKWGKLFPQILMDVREELREKKSTPSAEDLGIFMAVGSVPESSVKEDIEKANAWAKSRLPHVPLHIVRGLIQMGSTTAYGMFHKGAISLSDVALEGTIYHEALHAVMRTYLSEKQIAQIFKEAKRIWGKELTDIQLEEKIAELFRETMLTGKVKAPSSATGIAKFFQDILDYVKHLLGHSVYINKLFSNIEHGKFDYATDPIMAKAHANLEPAFKSALSIVEREQAINLMMPAYFNMERIFRDKSPLEKTAMLRDRSVHQAFKSMLLAGFKQAAENSEHKENFERLFEDFDSLWESLTERLEDRFDIKLDTSELSVEEAEALVKDWDDNFMGVSQKDQISKTLKKKLMTMKKIEKIHYNMDTKKVEYIYDTNNFLGLSQYQNFEQVFPYLQAHLVGVTSLEDLLSILGDMSKFDPSFELLRLEVEKDENLQRMLLSEFRMQAPKMDLALVKQQGGNISVEWIQANRNDMVVMLSESWAKSIQESLESKSGYPFAKVKKAYSKAVRVLNTQVTDDSPINSEQAVEIAKVFSELLNTMGIKFHTKGKDMFPAALSHYFIGATYKDVKGLMDKFKHMYQNIEKTENFDNFGDLRALAGVVKLFRYDMIQNSALNAEGKPYYTVSLPSFLSERLNSIKNPKHELEFRGELANMLEDVEMRNSVWLENFIKKDDTGNFIFSDGLPVLNREFINNFDYSLLDGMKDKVSRNGARYSSLSEFDYDVLQLSMFFSNPKKTSASDLVKIPTLIPSDGSQLYTITTVKKAIEMNEQGEVSIDSPVVAALKGHVFGEINRIKKERERMFDLVDGKYVPKTKQELDADNYLIEHYHYKLGKNGERIYFKSGKPVGNAFSLHIFDNLNNSPLFDSKGMLRDGKVTDTEFIDQEILAVLKEEYDTHEKAINNSVFFTTTQDSKDQYNSTEQMRYEFVANTMLVNIEQNLWFNGTVAQYKSANQTNKRAKQVSTPGKIGAHFGLKGTFSVAVIQDIEVKSTSILDIIDTTSKSLLKDKKYSAKTYDSNKIMNRYENPETPLNDLEEDIYRVAKHYMGINAGDGQGYISVDRYERIIKSYGQYNAVWKKLFQDVRDGKELSGKDLEVFLNPLKGFYYKRSYDKNNKMMRSIQVKYSSLPLTPQLTKNFPELDQIRKHMENKQIDEVIFNSGIKEGAGKIHSIADQDGNLDSEALAKVGETPGDILDLDATLWRKQLDVPEHMVDSENKLGTQISKLMIGNIPDDRIYTIEGEEYTGAELKGEYSELLATNIEESLIDLLEDLGIDMETGALQNTDKVKDFLLKQLRSTGMNDNYKEVLEYIEGTKEFKLPLFTSLYAPKMESIILSLFTKRVVQQKFPGFSAVQFSNLFMSPIGKASENTQSKLGIKGPRLKTTVDSKTGIMTAEVMIKRNSKLLEGIDIEGLSDERVLEMIAYRIPTQAKHSAVIFKVVGFLPDESGSIIAMPDDIVAQTGSDFDIDKMYVMTPNLQKKDGKVTAIRYDKDKELNENSLEQRQNRVLEIFKSILKHPDHLKEQYSPAVFDGFENLRWEMDWLENRDDEINPHTWSGQREYRKRNVTGRILKGISANFNSFGAIAQVVGMQLPKDGAFKIKLKVASQKTTKRVKTSKGWIRVTDRYNLSELKDRYGEDLEDLGNGEVIISLYKLGNAPDGKFLNIEGDQILEHASQGIGASVDIVNNPTFSSFNVDAFTYPLFHSMMLTGFSERHAGMFINQPILVTLADSVANQKGILSDGDSFYRVLKDLISEKVEELSGVIGLSEENKKTVLKAIFAKDPDSKAIMMAEYMLGIDSSEVFPEDALLNMIGFESDPTDNSEVQKRFLSNQLAILLQFKKMQQMAALVNNGVKGFKPDSRSAGPSSTEIHEMEFIVNKLNPDEDGNALMVEENGELHLAKDLVYSSLEGTKTSKLPHFDSLYGVQTVARKFLGQLFPHEGAFSAWTTELMNITGSYSYNKDVAKKFNSFLYSSMLKDLDFFSSRTAKDVFGLSKIENKDITKPLEIEDFKKLSAARKLVYVKKHFAEELGDMNVFNYLSGKISFKDRKKNEGLETISFENVKDKDLDNVLIHTFEQNYHSDNAFIADLAKDLIIYSFHSNGLSFALKSFAHLIPVSILSSEDLGIQKHLKQVEKQLSQGGFEFEDIARDFVRHYGRDSKVLPTVYSYKGKSQYAVRNKEDKTLVIDPKSGAPKSVTNSRYVRYLSTIKDPLGETINTLDELYELVGEDQGLLIFERMDSRGKKGSLMELGVQSSILSTNAYGTNPYDQMNSHQDFSAFANLSDSQLASMESSGKDYSYAAEAFENSMAEDTSKALEAFEAMELKGSEMDAIAESLESTKSVPTVKEKSNTYSGTVTKLKPNQVFVFGSNPEGRHGLGAAKVAMKFGAKRLQGRGMQGQSYGLVTKNLTAGYKEDSTGITYETKGAKSVSPDQIIKNISELYKVANSNPSKEYLVNDYSGKNHNGYSGQEMADMFDKAGPIPSNMVFNENFSKLLSTNNASDAQASTVKEKSNSSEVANTMNPEMIEDILSGFTQEELDNINNNLENPMC